MYINVSIELLVQTILTATVGWAVKVVLDRLKEYTKESKEWRHSMADKLDKINDATQANMRTNILHYCEKYLNRGWITSEELASLTDMHEKYSTLNAHNGFINGYMDRVNNLEVKEI